VDTKHPIFSRTLCINLMGALTSTAVMSHNPAVATVATVLQDPAAQAQLFALAISVGNFALRLVTTKKLAF